MKPGDVERKPEGAAKVQLKGCGWNISPRGTTFLTSLKVEVVKRQDTTGGKARTPFGAIKNKMVGETFVPPIKKVSKRLLDQARLKRLLTLVKKDIEEMENEMKGLSMINQKLERYFIRTTFLQAQGLHQPGRRIPRPS